MTSPPLTLFSRAQCPAEVAGWIKEFAPQAVFTENQQHWTEARVSFGIGSKSGILIISHNPEYYSGADWSSQMDGMRKLLSSFPEGEHRDRILSLTTTFRFALGLIFDPDYARGNDPRLDLVYAIAQKMDAIFFSPMAMLDASGRTLYSMDGEFDTSAKWPKLLGEVELGPEPVDWNPNSTHDPIESAPTTQRVAKRALALAALTARAILEQNPSYLDPLNDHLSVPRRWLRKVYLGHFGWGKPAQTLIDWVQALDLQSELEPEEWKGICKPLGKLLPQEQINATWRLEGLVVLAWALGMYEVPPHDELVNFYPMWRNLGLLNVERAKELIDRAQLRPRQEIQRLRSQIFSLNWRMTNYRLRPEVIDFAEFARTCWFGPLDITPWPLKQGDLEIQGSRIDRTSRDNIAKCGSIAVERHIAINWLWGGPDLYSMVYADT